MLNNVKLKKFLKSTIFKPLTWVNRYIPKDDKVVLLHSSIHGVIYNLKPVKEYLLENGYDQKYRIVCGIENMSYAEDDNQRVEYVTYLKSILTFFRAKHVFYTAGQIPIKPSSDQTVIFFDHGTAAFKTGGALSGIHNGDEFFFTYILSPSPLYVPILEKEYLCKKENILISGEPMTDVLYKPVKKYNLGDFDKVIFWMPTFRQSKYLNYDDSNAEILPMFSFAEYEELNEHLKFYDFKLIVKLHPMQDVDQLKTVDLAALSNIEVLSSDNFDNMGYETYEMMKQADALIGDYSSASLHYLHLDRPMAFVIPDIEEYKEKRGFVFENPEDYMAGELIYNKEQLYDFFDHIANGKDEYKEKRERVRKEIFAYTDGKDTQRALQISNISLEEE